MKTSKPTLAVSTTRQMPATTPPTELARLTVDANLVAPFRTPLLRCTTLSKPVYFTATNRQFSSLLCGCVTPLALSSVAHSSLTLKGYPIILSLSSPTCLRQRRDLPSGRKTFLPLAFTYGRLYFQTSPKSSLSCVSQCGLSRPFQNI